MNVTTGVRYEHNWTGVTDEDVYTNGEINIVGVNGGHADEALTISTGEIIIWNFANDTQWVAGTQAFFEANNDWFVDALNSWIDMSADGSSNDQVIQYQFNGVGITNVWEGYGHRQGR